MANKEEFKSFVRKNPKLFEYVKKGDMSWQKFYELFDLYGEEGDVWTPYLAPVSSTPSVATTPFDTFGWLRNLDLDSIQEGINSLQRVVGVVGDLTNKNTTTKDTSIKEEYKPRPLYKHFED